MNYSKKSPALVLQVMSEVAGCGRLRGSVSCWVWCLALYLPTSPGEGRGLRDCTTVTGAGQPWDWGLWGWGALGDGRPGSENYCHHPPTDLMCRPGVGVGQPQDFQKQQLRTREVA